MRTASYDSSLLEKGVIRQIMEVAENLKIEKTESGINKFLLQ